MELMSQISAVISLISGGSWQGLEDVPWRLHSDMTKQRAFVGLHQGVISVLPSGAIQAHSSGASYIAVVWCIWVLRVSARRLKIGEWRSCSE